MKRLTPTGIKSLKILHLFFALLWICGAIALLIILVYTKPVSGDELYMKSRIIQLVDDLLIIPGAIGCLLTGIIYGVWTSWGFFKHTWITVKWIMTVLQIGFGTFILGPWVNTNVEIADQLRDTALQNAEFISNSRNSLLWGGVQTSFLLLYLIISVFKPWKKRKDSEMLRGQKL